MILEGEVKRVYRATAVSSHGLSDGTVFEGDVVGLEPGRQPDLCEHILQKPTSKFEFVFADPLESYFRVASSSRRKVSGSDSPELIIDTDLVLLEIPLPALHILFHNEVNTLKQTCLKAISSVPYFHPDSFKSRDHFYEFQKCLQITIPPKTSNLFKFYDKAQKFYVLVQG